GADIMGFKEEILTLTNQILARKEFVSNEETTKHSLIVPFIQTLGYDVFNPLEVRPEYTADFGKKKTEKVDYAIFKDGTPVMFIEAKDIKENLNNHDAQLSRYFNSTPSIKVAVLTNGIKYKFFTDLKTNNIMDSQPFFELDVHNVNDYYISILQKFSKEAFDIEQIISTAEELTYMSNINSRLVNLFESPTDEFIKLLIKDFNIRVTSTVLEKFRPIVKKSIKDALLEIISQGIFAKEIEDREKSRVEEPPKKQSKKVVKSAETPEAQANQQITTKEELEVFEIIKKVLIAYGKNIEEVNYKNANNSFSIYNKNPGKWFLKFSTDNNSKCITTRIPVELSTQLCTGLPVEQYTLGFSESRIKVNNYSDVKGLKSLVITCFDQVDSNKIEA
ncbi:MAG: type I restriction enzyme HsdR N-terminal domain-containing protein, partial [Bacillota bacterium]|nr:type I restriction enzyme HsdR N-terminal domain-containing protein [Bacillota bacterium]